jgi:hypothetical protein
MSNLILLCHRYHDAAHEQATAPTVDFRSTGQMSTDSFGMFLEFFRELPAARFDDDEEVWRIPKADFVEEVVREISELGSRHLSPREVNDDAADSR